MKIAAGICTYSDALSLARCLESLNDGAIDCKIIHGPYPFYSAIDDDSLENTRAVCQAYPNTQLIDLPLPTPEIERRQTYLNLASDYDLLLVIDSDEYIEKADWPLFKRECKRILETGPHHYIYDILFGGHPAQVGPRPRLFREPSKIKYWKKHYWWLLPNGKVAAGASDSITVVNGITIMHDDQLRPDNRLKARTEYQAYLLRHESQYTL
jgi:glycosyltransferase involved in cell wall biosynthesis